MLMSVYHLHVVKYVLTLLVVTSAPVMVGMNWIMMEELAMVCTVDDRIDIAIYYFLYQFADIDECHNSFPCSQMCNNTIGSFRCSCNSGYTVDGTMCNGQ